MSDSSQEVSHVEILKDVISNIVTKRTQLRLNIDVDIIVIEENKVRLILMGHLRRVETKRQWIAPLGILLSIAITLYSANFHDAFLEAAVWKALFIVVGIIDAIWLIKSLYDARNASGVEDVVDEMKRARITTTENSGDGKGEAIVHSDNVLSKNDLA